MLFLGPLAPRPSDGCGLSADARRFRRPDVRTLFRLVYVSLSYVKTLCGFPIYGAGADAQSSTYTYALNIRCLEGDKPVLDSGACGDRRTDSRAWDGGGR